MLNVKMVLLLNLFFVTTAFATGAKKQYPRPEYASESQILVSLEAKVTEDERQKIFKKFEVKEIEKVGSTALYLVEVKDKSLLSKTMEGLSKTPGVRYAEPNLRLTIQK